jgi:hypothetical protein
MEKPLYRAAIVLIACLIGACTRVGHIQQTAPVRSMTFTGSPVTVAQCVHRRVGGRIHDEGFGEKYVIYDAVKTKQADGLTHFAVTVGKRDATRGFAEWRVLRPTRAPGPNQPPVPRLSDAAVQEYWRPVQQCASEAQAPK